MATIKVLFRPATEPGADPKLLYRITHQSKMCTICAYSHIEPCEWDTRLNRPANSLASEIYHDRERLTAIERRLSETGLPYTVSDIASDFLRFRTTYSLRNYAAALSDRLKENGKIRTAETYRAALASFMRFRGGTDILLDRLTPTILEHYQQWMRKRGLSSNTMSFYNRILRAIYNRAADDGVFENRHPFRRVYTGVGKTAKRALAISVIKKIKNLDLEKDPMQRLARDMFMLSFYMRGMSFIDMCFLRKSDRHGNIVTYRRRKTGQQLTIKWTIEMQEIISHYPKNTSDYLLPLITKPSAAERSVYLNLSYNINRNLKKIAARLGLQPITLYAARHSWASAAQSKGIPVGVISEGMGHDSESTTRIYLASLDTSAVDRANASIIKSIR